MVGQESYQIETQSLNMMLNRQSPSSLGTNMGTQSDEDAGFKLSFDAITDEKAQDSQFIDTLVRKY